MKDLILQRHPLRSFGRLSRDFSLFYRKEGVLKAVSIVIKKNGRGARYDFWLWDPIEGGTKTLHWVGARLKEGRLTPAAMAGRQGDHNRGYAGWDKLKWQRLRSEPRT
jgi:hypothetical protein